MQSQKRFWDTRTVTAYSVTEDVRRFVVDIEYTEPFRGGLAVRRYMAFIPKQETKTIAV